MAYNQRLSSVVSVLPELKMPWSKVMMAGFKDLGAGAQVLDTHLFASKEEHAHHGAELSCS